MTGAPFPPPTPQVQQQHQKQDARYRHWRQLIDRLKEIKQEENDLESEIDVYLQQIIVKRRRIKDIEKQITDISLELNLHFYEQLRPKDYQQQDND
jgi:chromosome segregation ATPase